MVSGQTLANEKVIIPVARQYGVVVLIQNFGPVSSQAEIAKARLYEEREQERINLERKRINTVKHYEEKKLEAIESQADHVIDQLKVIRKAILQLTGSTEEDDIKQRNELIRQHDELTESSSLNLDRLDWEESSDHLTHPQTGLENLRLAHQANPRNIPYDSNLPNLLPSSKRLDHKESKKDS